MNLSKEEAAEFLGVSIRTLERYSKQGKISVTYVKQGRTRCAIYKQSDLKDFKQNDSIETVKPAFSNLPPTTPDKALAISGEASAINSKLILSLTSYLERIALSLEELRQPTNSKSVAIEEKILLSLTETQALTGLSKNTLKTAIKQKILPAKRIGRGWKIKRTDLNKYVENL